MTISKKSLSNLKPIKKGEVRNPHGAKTHSPELKQIKRLTEAELIEVGSMVIKGSVDQLRAIAKDGTASALKCMIAAVAVKTISKGDPHALDTLLNRLVGKVKQEHAIGDANGNALAPAQIFIGLPPNGFERKKEE